MSEALDASITTRVTARDRAELAPIVARGGHAHAYLFDWSPPTSRFRSCHTIELPFVFATRETYHDAPVLAGGGAPGRMPPLRRHLSAAGELL